jgi:hypothetical protein
MFNQEYVTDVLDEFDTKVDTELKNLSASEDYKISLSSGVKQVSNRCSKIFSVIKKSIPTEVSIDYVIMQRYSNESLIRLAFKDNNSLDVKFEFTKVFDIEGCESDVAVWLVDCFKNVIKYEYAAYNLKELNKKLEYYCKEAYREYTVEFCACLQKDKLIQDISNKHIKIAVDIDKAIDLADTQLFNVKNSTRDNRYLNNVMIKSFVNCLTTVEFLSSKNPLFVYLTGIKDPRVNGYIQEVYPKNFEDITVNNGIGYYSKNHVFGYKQKVSGKVSWYLNPYNTKTFHPIKGGQHLL